MENQSNRIFKPSQDSVQSITKVETTQPKPEQNTPNSSQNIVKKQ